MTDEQPLFKPPDPEPPQEEQLFKPPPAGQPHQICGVCGQRVAPHEEAQPGWPAICSRCASVAATR